MKVFLAGIGCVGKTAIGASLAARLGCRFYDLDAEIEKHFGKPIEQLRTVAPSPDALLNGCDDETVIAMWRETETGMIHDAEGRGEPVVDCVRMNLEMELLEVVAASAYDEAEG